MAGIRRKPDPRLRLTRIDSPAHPERSADERCDCGNPRCERSRSVRYRRRAGAWSACGGRFVLRWVTSRSGASARHPDGSLRVTDTKRGDALVGWFASIHAACDALVALLDRETHERLAMHDAELGDARAALTRREERDGERYARQFAERAEAGRKQAQKATAETLGRMLGKPGGKTPRRGT